MCSCTFREREGEGGREGVNERERARVRWIDIHVYRYQNVFKTHRTSVGRDCKGANLRHTSVS
jgi:hypothetical protein